MNDFIAIYDIGDTIESVIKDLKDKENKNGLNLKQQVALVTKNGDVIGYLDPVETIESYKSGHNFSLDLCVKIIGPSMFIEDNTTLVEFADVVGWDDAPPQFFVLNVERVVIGWVTYYDINKSFFHLCLFALILEVEGCLLKALGKFPRAFDLLNENRQRNVHEVYMRNKFESKMYGPPSYQNLLKCTTLVDRIKMLKMHPLTKDSCSAINDRKYSDLLIKIRNKVAHPGLSENLANHISREDLFPFIGWTLELSEQLEKLSADKSIYQ